MPANETGTLAELQGKQHIIKHTLPPHKFIYMFQFVQCAGIFTRFTLLHVMRESTHFTLLPVLMETTRFTLLHVLLESTHFTLLHVLLESTNFTLIFFTHYTQLYIFVFFGCVLNSGTLALKKT